MTATAIVTQKLTQNLARTLRLGVIVILSFFKNIRPTGLNET
jgi:hypothetical protein